MNYYERAEDQIDRDLSEGLITYAEYQQQMRPIIADHSSELYDSPPATPPSESDREFEQWYVTNAFDYERNPLGCRDCGLQRKAWEAARQHFQPAPIPEARVLELWEQSAFEKQNSMVHGAIIIRFADLLAREDTGGKP